MQNSNFYAPLNLGTPNQMKFLIVALPGLIHNAILLFGNNLIRMFSQNFMKLHNLSNPFILHLEKAKR